VLPDGGGRRGRHAVSDGAMRARATVGAVYRTVVHRAEVVDEQGLCHDAA
jgi:hypothetical protein